MRGDGYLNAALYGQPRFLLTFAEPIEITGLFGVPRTVRCIGIGLDDDAPLRERLAQNLHDRIAD